MVKLGLGPQSQILSTSPICYVTSSESNDLVHRLVFRPGSQLMSLLLATCKTAGMTDMVDSWSKGPASTRDGWRNSIWARWVFISWLWGRFLPEPGPGRVTDGGDLTPAQSPLYSFAATELQSPVTTLKGMKRSCRWCWEMSGKCDSDSIPSAFLFLSSFFHSIYKKWVWKIRERLYKC